MQIQLDVFRVVTLRLARRLYTWDIDRDTMANFFVADFYLLVVLLLRTVTSREYVTTDNNNYHDVTLDKVMVKYKLV